MAQNEEKYFCSDISEIPKIVSDLRSNHLNATPTSYSYRISQIRAIIQFCDENKDELIAAARHYYGGSKSTHFLGRIWMVKYDCYDAMKNLDQWMKPTKKSQPFPFNLMWSAKVQPHPLGVTCVIAPWNYPIGLLLRPLIGAIAAGNAVVLKPSEVTDKVARVIYEKLPQYLDPKMVRVVCGGAAETSALLKEKLDFVLFTGGGSIGKIVMNAFSKHLTPCCLELGGKNPVILDDDVNLDTSIKRIVYGRYNFNGGQICVAPEYVFISKSKQDDAIEIVRKYLKEFYGEKGETEKSDDYFHIVSKRHFDRLQKVRSHYLVEESDRVAIGGGDDELYGPQKVNAETRHLPPMVLRDVDFEGGHVMKEEVFGPILSLIPMDGTFSEWKNKAISMVRSRDTPLAFYLFTRDQRVIDEMSSKINAGSFCVNDTIMFLALRNMPFGGCGASGMGRYAGKYTFDTFSHQKPVAIRSHGTEFLNKDRYPNYDRDVADLDKKLKREAKMLKMYEGLYPKEQSTFKRYLKWWAILTAVAAFAYYYQRIRR